MLYSKKITIDTIPNVIIFFLLIVIPFSYPLLTYPYDIYAHLIAMDDISHQLPNSTTIPENRLLWHTIWSNIFLFLNIDNNPFFRAKIIHVLQSYLSLFLVYYFSKVIIRNLFKNINPTSIHLISLWSLIIWYTIYASGVGYDHQIWNQYYSVNYQITLVLFWYITALTLILFLEKTSIKKKIFFILQILIISKFILQVHAMEFMYYLMYVFIFSLVYIDKIYPIFKKYYYIIIPIPLGFIYYLKEFHQDSSKIFNYFTLENFPTFYDEIINIGQYVIKHLNRSYASINELMYFIYFTTILMILFLIWDRYHHKSYINTRLFIVILITSLFVLIPLFEFSAGLFAIITRADVIHRIYYSSSLFILLPIFIYYLHQKYQLKWKYLHILLVFSLIAVFIFSKYNNSMSHNYYKNIISIQHSFSKEHSSFNLSKKQIALIGNKLDEYERSNTSGRKIFYYARADISFVIKYIYRKKVYWKGRRKNPKYKSLYATHKENKNYYKVLFETPKMFPEYIPYQ